MSADVEVKTYSLEEFATLPDRPIPAANEKNYHTGLDTGLDCGDIKSWDDARRYFDRGWEKGAARLSELAKDLKEITLTAKSRKRQVRWEDQGDDLHIERALAGEWDHAWRTTRREWRAGPTTVNLLVSYGGNFKLSADQLFYRGAAAYVLVDLLENAGYRVAVTAACPIQRCPNDRSVNSFFVGQILLKDVNEPLRPDALASLLCHAGIFRTYGFRAVCDCSKDVGYNIGIPISWSDIQFAMVAAWTWPEDAIVVESANTKNEALAIIESTLKEIQK